MPHRFMTLREIRRAAKTMLPPGPWAFGAGGAETETTRRRNRRALKRLAIRQRVLRDVRHIDISTTFLGLELPTPLPSHRWAVWCFFIRKVTSKWCAEQAPAATSPL